MAIIAKGGFAPAPAGQWQAVCVDVVDLGLSEKTYNGQKVVGKDGKPVMSHNVCFVWEINEPMPGSGRPYIVGRKFTLSLHEKASLREATESWLGRTLTEREVADGFDVESFIGRNCQLTVVHNVKATGTYANVTAIVPLMKGMKDILPTPDYVRVCDRPSVTEPNGDPLPDDGDPGPQDSDIPF